MRVQEKNIKGFSILELLVVLSIVAIISALSYPSFSSWNKEREARSSAERIKALYKNINSQVQRGMYAYVQVLVEEELVESEDKQLLMITSKGMKMNTLMSKVNDGEDAWNKTVSTRCNITDADYWDESGNTTSRPEVSFLKFENITVNFNNNVGAVCFSTDGTWYSGAGQFSSESGGETSVDSVFFICSRSSDVSVCEVSEIDGKPSKDHDILFAISWARFGNITLEKWSKSRDDWILQ